MKTFFKDKKVFITGHTGFKGSWLTTILNSWGAIVKGYALEPKTKDDFFLVNKVGEKCDSVIADINNSTLLEKEILNFEPQFIFHLAAQPLVRESYEIPLETWNTNVMGTANLLNSIRGLPNEVTIIIVTTDKVYLDNDRNHPYKEDDRLGGNDPYSASKAACELLVSSYHKSFFKNNSSEIEKRIASVRAGNVIGGGDWAKDRLIPDIVRALKNEEMIEIRNPDAIRPWQHVFEPLFGYLYLAKNLDENPKLYSGPWNFGPYPKDSIPVLEVVKHAIKVLEKGDYNISPDNTMKTESKFLSLDISKAINVLGWKPKLNTLDAVEMALIWYKNYLENPSEISGITDKMIEGYFN